MSTRRADREERTASPRVRTAEADRSANDTQSIPDARCLPLHLLAVVSAPCRFDILVRLSRSPLDVSTIASELELDIRDVSYHLK